MQHLKYRHAPEYEQAPPLTPGTYGPSGGRRVLMILGSLAFVAIGVWLMRGGPASEPGGVQSLFYIALGAVSVLFFLPAGIVWAVQATKITATGVRARLPLPRTAGAKFRDVRAVVIYPAVANVNKDMQLIALLDSEGLSVFQMQAPPYEPSTLEGLCALVHLTSGAKVYVCLERVSDTQFFKNVHLPHLARGYW